jgi:hypothetical protein
MQRRITPSAFALRATADKSADPPYALRALTLPDGQMPMREKLIFRNNFNVICPDQPRLKK